MLVEADERGKFKQTARCAFIGVGTAFSFSLQKYSTVSESDPRSGELRATRAVWGSAGLLGGHGCELFPRRSRDAGRLEAPTCSPITLAVGVGGAGVARFGRRMSAALPACDSSAMARLRQVQVRKQGQQWRMGLQRSDFREDKGDTIACSYLEGSE